MLSFDGRAFYGVGLRVSPNLTGRPIFCRLLEHRTAIGAATVSENENSATVWNIIIACLLLVVLAKSHPMLRPNECGL